MARRRQKTTNGNTTADFRGVIESMTERDDRIELGVRLHNSLDRSIHYISDVRAIIYDAPTRHLRVQLSDKGRSIPLTSIPMEPRFRVVDPHSESVINIRVPKTMVKLSNTPSPTGKIIFEEQAITDASSVELEIGWADTPYYHDPREKSRGTSPIASWERRSLRVAFKARPKSKQKSG
jgi:hypothetical protein